MSQFTYCGTTPRAYPETRDAGGVIIGTVSCGDARDLAGPPDADWFPASGPLPVRLPPEPQEPAEPPPAQGGTGGGADTASAATPSTAASGKPQSSPAGGSGTPAGSSPATLASTPPTAATTPAGDGQKAA